MLSSDLIISMRLEKQQISKKNFKTPAEIVSWMGAMQAQDYAMVKWAIGSRLSDTTEKKIEESLNKGEILRTHLLRPTWHLVSPEDIHRMIELSAPQIKTVLKSRHIQLGLTEAIVNKSNELMEKSLEGGKQLTRDELMEELKKSKIEAANIAAAHLLLHAEIAGIICSGPAVGNNTTYMLLRERVPKPGHYNRDEALALLALRYFTSRCPATLQDFTWWSGLPATAARHALEMVKPNFISEKVDKETYWLTNSFSDANLSTDEVYLLPAFDEFIISYRKRDEALPHKHYKKAVSDNGIFRPVLVINGKIIGIWKRTFKKDIVIIEIQLFRPLNKQEKKSLEIASTVYGQFLNKKVHILI